MSTNAIGSSKIELPPTLHLVGEGEVLQQEVPAEKKKDGRQERLKFLLDRNNDISLEEMLELDLASEVPTLTHDAYSAYIVNSDGRDQLRNYLNMNELKKIRAAQARFLGEPRSITLDELKMLVDEEEKTICTASGDEMVAVKWFEAHEDFLILVEKVGVAEATQRSLQFQLGCFFTEPEADITSELYAFSGGLYWASRVADGSFRFLFNNRTALGQVTQSMHEARKKQDPKSPAIRTRGLSRGAFAERKRLREEVAERALQDRQRVQQANKEKAEKNTERVRKGVAAFMGRAFQDDKLYMREPVKPAKPRQGKGAK